MARLPIFMGFSPQEMNVLSTIFSVKRMSDGDVLWRESDASHHFAIVAEGAVGVFKELSNGKRHRMGSMGVGRMLGQLGLVDGGKRESTLVAERGGCVALMCQRDDFERLFTTNNPFAYKLLDFIVTDLSQRLRESLNSLDSIISNPAEISALLIDKLTALGRSVHESGEIPQMVMKGGMVRPAHPSAVAPASNTQPGRMPSGVSPVSSPGGRPTSQPSGPGSSRR